MKNNHKLNHKFRGLKNYFWIRDIKELLLALSNINCGRIASEKGLNIYKTYKDTKASSKTYFK
jgi:hypothetical protein